MHKRPRVLLLIPHLGGGGAERVTALLTGELSAQKYEIHLGLITEGGSEPEMVPARMNTHRLRARRVRSSAFSLLRLVRRIRPDVILSGMAHLNFLVLLLRPLFPRKTRVLVRQNATASQDLDSGRVPVYTRFLYRLLYPSADRIVCQTHAMAFDLAEQSQLSEEHVQVLPNPVDVDAIRAAPFNACDRWSGPGPHLLAVGRLSCEKGFDILLEAFASLRVKFPDADLTIVGSGPAEDTLRALRLELRLESSVQFTGYVPRPESFFPGASMFVLPSRREGLPNALLEAAAGGLPIVSTPASEGIVNLLDGRSGTWIAAEASSAALTASLLQALGTLRPGQRFAHAWVERFHMDCAVRAYERLIDETLQEQLQ